jgi:aspartate/tyrosine/aromatic aminotransferase
MSSFFADVKIQPPDAIFGIRAAYIADTNPDKIDVAIGAYRTEEGKVSLDFFLYNNK